MTVDDLWAGIDARVLPLGAERVPLEAALGRRLREDICADADQPAFTRSAIDGYLTRAGETATVLQIEAEVRPGAPAGSVPEPGTAHRIFTGSALPESGGALVMQEDVESEGGAIRLLAAPGAKHIRRRGAHRRAGDRLISSGARLNPGALSLLASAGCIAPLVSRVPRVAHIITGSEIVPAGQTPGPGQIRDSNSVLISALLQREGAELVLHRRIDEEPEAAIDAVREAQTAGADVVLISGGASVGDHDHTGAVLEKTGFTIHCRKVRSRPGKPLIFASQGAMMAFGLPGNPLSHFVCFHVFVRRALARMTGADPAPLLLAAMDSGADVRADERETWWPCQVSWRDASLLAAPQPWRDSSDMTVLADANALCRFRAGQTPGPATEVLLCDPLP